MLLCHWQDNVWADGTWDPNTWVCVEPPPIVAGTGKVRTGEERLAALAHLFEQGKTTQLASAIATLENKRADYDPVDDEVDALIAYWLHGGF